MYRCEIIANQSVQDEITTLLEEHIPDVLYTIVPLVTGRGKNSYKMGSSTWPETNFLLFSYVRDDDLPKVRAIIKAVKARFTSEGIKLFVVKAENGGAASSKNRAAKTQKTTPKPQVSDIQAQFNRVASKYDKGRRSFIPCFDSFYKRTTDFLATTLRAPQLVFDLGSGTGLLPSFWFPHFPDSDYVLCDIADEMLAIAKKRFKSMPNVRFEQRDYAESLPEGSPGLVMSALSIHHLEHEAKRALFKRIFDALGDGGVFVNYDQFCQDDKILNEQTERFWTQQIHASGLSDTDIALWQERKKLDRECSVMSEISWLRDAGFRAVECVFSDGKFGVIAARKS